MRFAEQPDRRIRLELEHVSPVTAERWAQFGPGAVGIGWDLVLMGLAQYISGDEPMDPQQGAAWVGSADGRRFIALSTEWWCQASIAAGTPASQTQWAAERTVAFYTGSAPGSES